MLSIIRTTPDSFGFIDESLRFRLQRFGNGMSGLELEAKLKSEQLRIPIIFITAHGDEKMRIQALRAGAVDFLIKPFGKDALLSSVRAALDC